MYLNLLVPSQITDAQDKDLLENWYLQENKFCRDRSTLLIILGFVGYIFGYLDTIYSPISNPDWSYIAVSRGVGSTCLLITGLWLRCLYKPRMDMAWVLIKTAILIGAVFMVYRQIVYTSDFPDRDRMIAPIMMSLAVYLVRVGKSVSLLLMILYVAMWLPYSEPKFMQADINYMAIGLLMIMIFRNGIHAYATLFLEKYNNEQVLKFNQYLTWTLSHDINNSLTVAHSSMFMLEREVGKDSKFVKRGTQALKNISEVIDTTRKFEAIRIGKSKINLSPQPIMECIEKAIPPLERMIEKKEIKLVINSDSTLLQTDLQVLSNNIIRNILSNSIKFSDTGGTIEISTEQLDQEMHIHIKDYGIGIPDDVKESIFVQAQPSNRRGTCGEVGTGFGMLLVDFFTKSLGGRIRVESQDKQNFPDDHWTQFTLSFPMEESLKPVKEPS